MKNYKKGLIVIFAILIFVAICVTLFLRGLGDKKIQTTDQAPTEIQQSEKEQVIDQLNVLLPETEKTEEEIQVDIDLLERSQENSSSNLEDLELLNEVEQTDEQQRKLDLLESLSN